MGNKKNSPNARGAQTVGRGNQGKQNAKQTGWSDQKKLLVAIAGIAVLVALIVTIALSVTYCGAKDTYVAMTVEYVNAEGETETGEIVIRLRADVAPITVKNFTSLVSSGFYDGLTFHRIMPGFMIQGGDPNGDGTGGSGTTPIKGEFSSNGVNNTLSHTRGVISMARTSDPNSATSQFFIVNDDSAARSLDGNYAAFGEVVSGMDVVDGITGTECVYNSMSGELSKPVNPPKILSARIVE